MTCVATSAVTFAPLLIPAAAVVLGAAPFVRRSLVAAYEKRAAARMKAPAGEAETTSAQVDGAAPLAA